MDTFLDDFERSADAESGLMFMDRIGLICISRVLDAEAGAAGGREGKGLNLQGKWLGDGWWGSYFSGVTNQLPGRFASIGNNTKVSKNRTRIFNIDLIRIR